MVFLDDIKESSLIIWSVIQKKDGEVIDIRVATVEGLELKDLTKHVEEMKCQT